MGIELAKTLQQLMEKKALTTSELAKNVSIPISMISRILLGENKNPKFETLKKISDYFGVTLSQLCGEAPKDIDSWENDPCNWTKIPLLSWEQAISYPELPSSEDLSFTVTERPVSKNSFAIVMKGESMNPPIPDRSILVIDPEVSLEDRCYVLAHLRQENRLVVKQLIIVDEVRYLQSTNIDLPKTSPIKMAPFDVVKGGIFEIKYTLISPNTLEIAK